MVASGCHPICINNKWYVPWTFPALDIHDSSTEEICRPCNTNNDDDINHFLITDIEYETTREDNIPENTVPMIDIFPESDVESTTTETTSNSNDDYKKPSYAAMTEISNKIISFPELKKG